MLTGTRAYALPDRYNGLEPGEQLPEVVTWASDNMQKCYTLQYTSTHI